MNILLVDTQATLNREETLTCKARIKYSLARFEHKINGVTIHFSSVEDTQQAVCTLNVSLEGVGILSVTQKSQTATEALNLSIDSMETKIACRIDWRARFNPETYATWKNSLVEPVNKILDLVIRRDKAGSSLNSLPIGTHQPHFSWNANDSKASVN